jgi:hypothetical protein
MNYVLCLSEMRLVPVLPVVLPLSTEYLVLSPCWTEQTPDSREPMTSGHVPMNEQETDNGFIF